MFIEWVGSGSPEDGILVGLPQEVSRASIEPSFKYPRTAGKPMPSFEALPAMFSRKWEKFCRSCARPGEAAIVACT